MRRNFWISSAVIGLLGLVVVGAGACGRHHARGAHAMFHGDGEIDVDELRHGARWMLRGADPTDEQLNEIAGIARDAILEMRGLHGDREAHHAEMTAALSGESIDREALEGLRSDALARLDQGSRQAVDAFVRVAEVLTPEQRAALIEEHEEHRGRWGRGH